MNNTIPSEHLAFKPYKTVIEGNYYGYLFELDEFRDGNWQINWLESSPPTLSKEEDDKIENFIHAKIIENFGNSER